MRDSITIETDIFEHREVKAHFINPCCFGEDLAAWMKGEVSSLGERGFTFSELIQEDYGWGFWATHGEDTFWISFGYVGDGPQEEPAQWVVSIDYEPGLNVVRHLFHKPDPLVFAALRDYVWKAMQANISMRIIDDTESHSDDTHKPNA